MWRDIPNGVSFQAVFLWIMKTILDKTNLRRAFIAFIVPLSGSLIGTLSGLPCLFFIACSCFIVYAINHRFMRVALNSDHGDSNKETRARTIFAIMTTLAFYLAGGSLGLYLDASIKSH